MNETIGTYFLTALEAGRCLRGWLLVRIFFLACWWLICLCILMWPFICTCRENILWMYYFSYKTIIPESTFKTLFNLNWFLKALASKHSCTWVWLFTYLLGRGHHPVYKSYFRLFPLPAITRLPCFWMICFFISCRCNAFLGHLHSKETPTPTLLASFLASHYLTLYSVVHSLLPV